MSGKSEMDEPFLVEGLCHIFKDFDAAGVVFDEVVVGGEDSGDFSLGWERRQGDFKVKIIRCLFINLDIASGVQIPAL